jgi:hypothetical protein
VIIIGFALLLLILRVLYSVAEIYFEHDWPRSTWKGLALSAILFGFCISVFA